MPRTAGNSTPKYRRHRASGQAIVTIAGRDHYLGPHGTKASRFEYDRLVGEWMAAGRPTVVTSSPDITIAELVERYQVFAEGYYSPGGSLYNIRTSCHELRIRYGSTIAASFGPLALKAVRECFVDHGLSRTYCNRLTDVIRRLFKWGASEQLIPISTWQSLQAVSGLRAGHTDAHENEPVKPIDDRLVDATLPHLPSIVAAMVRLQRHTGMRPDEVCRLRPCEVDRSGDVWQYTPLIHKTAYRGRQRVVFIGPKGQSVLRSFLLRDSAAYCFVPMEATVEMRRRRTSERKTPLSCGNIPGSNHKKRPKRRPGGRYTTNSYRKAIHRACDAADEAARENDPNVAAKERIVPRWSPNRLRHSAATEIRRRFGLEAAQVVLGHAAADVTQVYAERDMEKAAAVIREVG